MGQNRYNGRLNRVAIKEDFAPWPYLNAEVWVWIKCGGWWGVPIVK
jgi:hypothetical protein